MAHCGRTLSLIEREANISPCLPSNLISAGNSLIALEPWMYLPGKTAFFNISNSFFIKNHANGRHNRLAKKRSGIASPR
jgi:hypothetical protein